MKKKEKNGSSVSYNGYVTVTMKSGRKRIKSRSHNEGTDRLFLFLANCARRNYDSTKSPWYIRLFHGAPSAENQKTTTAINCVSTAAGIIGEEGDGAYAELTFTIPGSSLTSSASSSADTIAIYDFDNKDISKIGNYLAKARLATPIETVDVGTNVVAVWRMEFRNGTEQQEESVQ